jgi:hypothetical protein
MCSSRLVSCSSAVPCPSVRARASPAPRGVGVAVSWSGRLAARGGPGSVCARVARAFSVRTFASARAHAVCRAGRSSLPPDPHCVLAASPRCCGSARRPSHVRRCGSGGVPFVLTPGQRVHAGGGGPPGGPGWCGAGWGAPWVGCRARAARACDGSARAARPSIAVRRRAGVRSLLVRVGVARPAAVGRRAQWRVCL